MNIAPIKVQPVTPERSGAIAMVVARTRATRLVAMAYLDAARGDVAAACESWRVDHGQMAQPAYCRRLMSLEASD